MSHESPPSRLLNKGAGSTPHHKSFLPPPASSDQMLASARPSSLGNAGADFVSLKLFPMSVERNTFMPKNGLQLEAYRRGVPRVSISVEYTGTPGPKGQRSAKLQPHPSVSEFSAAGIGLIRWRRSNPASAAIG